MGKPVIWSRRGIMCSSFSRSDPLSWREGLEVTIFRVSGALILALTIVRWTAWRSCEGSKGFFNIVDFLIRFSGDVPLSTMQIIFLVSLFRIKSLMAAVGTCFIEEKSNIRASYFSQSKYRNKWRIDWIVVQAIPLSERRVRAFFRMSGSLLKSSTFGRHFVIFCLPHLFPTPFCPSDVFRRERLLR